MVKSIDLLDSTDIFNESEVRWRIGLIVLATDAVLERDFSLMRPDASLEIYVNRIAFANPTTRENLLAMAPRLRETAALLLPGQKLDAIAYGCTSGTALIGYDTVARSIREAKPGVAVATPSHSAMLALKELGARRIGMLAPYVESVTRAVVDCFEAGGFEVMSPCCLGLEDDIDIARVSPNKIVEIAERTCPAEADAMFLSCTALRSIGVIEELESRLGIPVLSSNQVMFWRSMRVAGCDFRVEVFGRLLSEH